MGRDGDERSSRLKPLPQWFHPSPESAFDQEVQKMASIQMRKRDLDRGFSHGPLLSSSQTLGEGWQCGDPDGLGG
jgi:hypothetical protein